MVTCPHIPWGENQTVLSSSIGVSAETHALSQLADGSVLMRSSGQQGAIATPRVLARGPLAQAIARMNAGGAYQAYSAWAVVPLSTAFGGPAASTANRMGSWFGAQAVNQPVQRTRRFVRTGESAQPLVNPV